MDYKEVDIENFNKFFDTYSIEAVLDCGDYTAKSYLGITDDVCRYCGKTRPEVTFKNDPHVIPQALDNQFLLSHFECDNCNDLFKKYDDSISKYLGLYRTASGTKGKKYPKFKDDSTGIQAFMESDGAVKFIVPNLHELEHELKNNKITISAKNQPYIPIYVYKSLVKMAIAILPQGDLQFVSKTLTFLQEQLELSNPENIDIFKSVIHFIPGPPIVYYPKLILYKRKAQENEYPQFIVQFLYKNISFQFFLPFNENDNHIFNGVPHTIIFNPIALPIVHENIFGSKQATVADFRSSERTTDNSISLSFAFTTLTKHEGSI